ncbi:MAG: type I methionyl aminopeptidase [Phycisphaerae bacterium]
MRTAGVILKSTREIELMRDANRVVFQVHERMRELVAPGISTAELDQVAEEMILEAGGEPLFKGVENPQADFPFPAVLCTSVNDVLVHGIPDDEPLKEGDVVSIDCGVRLAGYCGDAAQTLPVGKIDKKSEHLLDVTRGALQKAIDLMAPYRMWSEIAREMQKVVEDQGLSVVREYVGHGIGRQMHEEPKVPNYWDSRQAASDFELVPGLVLAVEPMVNLGSHLVEPRGPGRWAIVTRDGKNAAHFEHTIAITDSGADVLSDGR